jgi:hypothetical protein
MFRIESDRFGHFWTRVLRVRDREAPGSNPGPPTKRGLKVEGITLWLFGGVSRISSETNSPGTQALFRGLGLIGGIDE